MVQQVAGVFFAREKNTLFLQNILIIGTKLFSGNLLADYRGVPPFIFGILSRLWGLFPDREPTMAVASFFAGEVGEKIGIYK